jgi:hypothetical protein
MTAPRTPGNREVYIGSALTLVVAWFLLWAAYCRK